MSGPYAYTAAWLAEMWPCVHEPDHEQRRREREAAALLADKVFERPAWCGDCDEFTRLVETDDGMARCGTCHSLAVAS